LKGFSSPSPGRFSPLAAFFRSIIRRQSPDVTSEESSLSMARGRIQEMKILSAAANEKGLRA
jgi:hypothetical protein